MSAASSDALAKRRQDFEDAMTALKLDENAKLAMFAAGSAWAKAAALHATSSYVEARTIRGNDSPGPN